MTVFSPTIFRLAALTASVAGVAACIDPIEAPPCNRVALSQVSTSVDTITTNTGLRYIEGATGSGAPIDWCQAVAIRYDAYLSDGTKFDSTGVDAPLVFTPGVGDLIDGIEQGVIGMRIEGKRRLIISPALGFGSEPRHNEHGDLIVPPNSTVIYDIEMIQAVPPS
jgi:FKBP-type peptidyl-prolyl cis-trans isomerase